MIPFAILSGKLYTTKGRSVEIRVLELGMDFFTFRLPKHYFEEDESVDRMTLVFFSHINKSYENISLNDVQMKEIYADDFATCYRVNGASTAFVEKARRLTKEYMEYVEAKLYLEDHELSHLMTENRYPLEEKIAGSREEQLSLWDAELQSKGKRVFVDGILLDTKEKCKNYLLLDKEEFLLDYQRKLAFGKENVSFQKVKYLYVGNAFCENLCVDAEMLLSIMAKAREQKLEMVWLLAPVSTSKWEKTTEMLRYVEESIKSATMLAEEENPESKVEVLAGDEGILNFMSKQKFQYLRGRKGILLEKKRKDPRMCYLLNEEAEGNGWYDTCEKEVFFPFYQTNTATFCTLHAQCKYGNRGKQERVLHCEVYCVGACVLYPTHLHMMGRYNSLFGMDFGMWTQEDAQSKYWGKRIILNL